jgi:hypothetical protein
VARGLAPKRLVVRPLGNAAGPSRRSVFHVPIAECDTIVHLNRSAEVQYYADPSPSTAPRHITVVLLPSFLGVFLSSTALGKGGVTGSKSSENEALIRTALAPYILANPQNSITIVGLDEANPFASAAHWSARQEHGAQEEMAFRDYLNRLMACAETVLPDGSRTAAWDDAARKHRQATIRVRTTREYFESGEWGPELDIAGSWLNCYYARFERDESEAAAAKAAAAAPRSGNYVIVPGSRPGHGHRYHNPTSTATTTFGIMTDMDMMRNFLMSTSNIHCVA